MKNYERPVLSFYFVSFVLNVSVFDYNGLKQSLILQTKPNRLLQISFFSQEPYLCLFKKSILRCMWRDLGMSLALYQSHLLASLILLRKFALILPGTHSTIALAEREQKRFTKLAWSCNYDAMIRLLLVESSVIVRARIFKNVMNNYA